MPSGIYVISGSERHGPIYVGQAHDIEKRWSQHRCLLGLGRHHNSRLQDAYNTQGRNHFHYLVAEYADSANLTEREQSWMDAFKFPDIELCNVGKAGRGSPFGRTMSDESKRKLSMALKATFASRPRREVSAEVRERISSALKGRILPAITRSKMSSSRSGRKLSESHRLSLSNVKRGVPLSDAHKAALRVAWVRRKSRS